MGEEEEDLLSSLETILSPHSSSEEEETTHLEFPQEGLPLLGEERTLPLSYSL